MRKLQEHPYMLLSSIVVLGLGISLMFTDANVVINIIYWAIGSFLILMGAAKILFKQHIYNQISAFALADGLVDLIVGILFLFFHNIIVTIILGLCFMIFPIIRIIKSSDHKQTLKKELPLLITGLVIALCGDALGLVVVKIIAGILILFGIYLFLTIFIEKIAFWTIKGPKNKKQRKDSVIDAEYEE
jgi:hypothetical protein